MILRTVIDLKIAFEKNIKDPLNNIEYFNIKNAEYKNLNKMIVKYSYLDKQLKNR